MEIAFAHRTFAWMSDAKTVLDVRAAHEGATLADLYDPDVMPEDLRKAHRALDEAVDRLYRERPR
jgi:hypothetical protein